VHAAHALVAVMLREEALDRALSASVLTEEQRCLALGTLYEDAWFRAASGLSFVTPQFKRALRFVEEVFERRQQDSVVKGTRELLLRDAANSLTAAQQLISLSEEAQGIQLQAIQSLLGQSARDLRPGTSTWTMAVGGAGNVVRSTLLSILSGCA